MNLKNVREYHEVIFNKFGILSSDNKCYEAMVEELIHKYLELSKEFNLNSKESFRREMFKIKTDRRN